VRVLRFGCSRDLYLVGDIPKVKTMLDPNLTSATLALGLMHCANVLHAGWNR
jgi:hypothetical protein